MIVLNKYKDDIEGAIYGGRGSPIGNPFSSGTREENIEKFEKWFLIKIESDPEFRSYVLSLRESKVWCFCRPKACHLDVIKNWLDERE